MAGRKGRSGGQNRKPPHLHLVDGTHREDRHGSREEAEQQAQKALERGVPKPPRWLSRSARGEWNRLAPQLAHDLLLTQEARASFAAYCEAWAMFVEAQAGTRKHLQQARVALAGARETPDSATDVTALEQIVASGGLLGVDRFGQLKQHPASIAARNAREQIRSLSVEFGLTPFSAGRVEPRAGRPRGSGGGQAPKPKAAVNRRGDPI